MPFPTYTISTDTADGQLNEGLLHREIVAAGPYSTTFEGVTADRNADSFTVDFTNPPTAGEQTTIDGVVAAHVGANKITELTWYVRPGGSDDNPGDAPDRAFATLDEAERVVQAFFKIFPPGTLQQAIDITGMKGVDAITKGDGPLHLEIPSAGYNFNLDASESGPNNFSNKAVMRLVSEPDLVQSVTIASVSHDPDTNLTTVTVNEALTAGAHKGQFLIGDGVLQHAAIADNTANTILLASSNDSFTGPVGIYEPGAEIISGDPAISFTGATKLVTGFANWFVGGIKFSSTNDSKGVALDVFGPGTFQCNQCQFTGLRIEGTASAGGSSVDASSIFDQGNNATFVLRNAGDQGIQLRHNFYEGIGIGWDTPWVILLGGWFEAPTDPVGRNHGVAEMMDFEEFEIANAVGIGLRGRNITSFNLEKGRIRDSGGDAVELVGGVHTFRGIVGTGNAGFGAHLQNGAKINLPGAVATTVSGASGEVSLGAVAGSTLWTAAPATDVAEPAPEFCGIY